MNEASVRERLRNHCREAGSGHAEDGDALDLVLYLTWCDLFSCRGEHLLEREFVAGPLGPRFESRPDDDPGELDISVSMELGAMAEPYLFMTKDSLSVLATRRGGAWERTFEMGGTGARIPWEDVIDYDVPAATRRLRAAREGATMEPGMMLNIEDAGLPPEGVPSF